MKDGRRESRIINQNEKREKPKIPELPKTREELGKLLIKPFKTSRVGEVRSEFGGEYHPGGVAVADVEIECPFCLMKFDGTESSGCFYHMVFPNTCPNCNFPINVLRAMEELRKEVKK